MNHGVTMPVSCSFPIMFENLCYLTVYLPVQERERTSNCSGSQKTLRKLFGFHLCVNTIKVEGILLTLELRRRMLKLHIQTHLRA